MSKTQKINNLINEFIEKWVPESGAHLLDSDENDGEKLRNAIAEIAIQDTIEGYQILKEAQKLTREAKEGMEEAKKETMKLIEEEAPKKARLIVIKESLFESIIQDFITFGGLIGLLAINYRYFENSTFGAWMLGIMFFVFLSSKASKSKTELIGKEALIKYLEKLKNH